MHAATTLSTTNSAPVFRSAMSLAPGRPRPLARRLAIHNRLMQSIRKFMDEYKFNEIPVSYPSAPSSEAAMSSQQTGYRLLQGMVTQGFPAVWCEGEQNAFETNDPKVKTLLTGFKLVQASMVDTSFDDLADTMEALVKTTVSDLGAELLGGRHIIRLDRMLSLDHPRIPYDLALEIVNHRGFNFQHGRTLPPEALATVTRYLNNLPFILTNQSSTSESLAYVFPIAGQLGHGFISRETLKNCGSFTIEVAPLLQYVMGLDSLNDAVIHPLGPVSTQSMKARQGKS